MIKSAEARSRVGRMLTAEDFGHPPHIVLFRALVALARAGLAYSEDTLADLARGSDFGGYSYIRALVSEYEPTRNIEYHVGRVSSDAFKLKMLDEVLPELAELCEDPASAGERITNLLNNAAQRSGQAALRAPLSGEALVANYYQTLQVRNALGGLIEGTGFPLLDSALVAGFAPRTFSIIAARPGHGKTTMVANILLNRLLHRKPTWCGAWEMEPEDYLDMMISNSTGVPAAVLYRQPGSLPQDVKDRVDEIIDLFRDDSVIEFQPNPFVGLPRPKDRFFDYNERNLDLFESEVERASVEGKAVFFLDVVGKMLPDKRPDSLSVAMTRLRSIAKHYAVHVCVLHHISRDGADNRPTLETLKGSGAFEEEADLVIGLDRPIQRASPAKREAMTDYLDAHILKQRKGVAPVCIRYRFVGTQYRMTDEMPVDLSMLEKEDTTGDREFR